MASRSSTTANVSRNVRSPLGRCELITARTATAKAMSVAVGIAQPRAVPSPALIATNSSAGSSMPPTAAATGSAARRGSRSSPATNSRLSSRPGHEEEDRQQAVGGPCAQAQVEVQCSGADRHRRAGRSTSWTRASCPDQCDRGADDQQQPTDRLGAQHLRDPRGLQERAPARTAGRGSGRSRGHGGSGSERSADQTSRRTSADLPPTTTSTAHPGPGRTTAPPPAHWGRGRRRAGGADRGGRAWSSPAWPSWGS